jgi:hypothetical protein
MSLAEILPAVRMLPREEQIQLLHCLVDELGRPGSLAPSRESELLEQLAAAASHQLNRPEFAPGAAVVLQELLGSQRDPNV